MAVLITVIEISKPLSVCFSIYDLFIICIHTQVNIISDTG